MSSLKQIVMHSYELDTQSWIIPGTRLFEKIAMVEIETVADHDSE